MLSTAQTIFACGLNRFGQLGDNTNVNRAVAVQAQTPAGVTFKAVSAGWDHSLALSTGGAVYAWGDNRFGQLGDNTFVGKAVPVAVGFPAGTPAMTAIAAGAYFSLSLDMNGQVWSWGYNGNGELGQGGFPPPVAVAMPGKVAAPANTGVTAIAAGADHSLAIVGGGVVAWGLNNYGQLGNNPNGCVPGPACPNSAVPVVAFPANSGVTAIAAGGSQSMAIIGGGVWVWGNNNKGQIGCGICGGGFAPAPVQLPGAVSTGVTAIAAGWQHSLALKGGAVLAWGWNSNGQLGDGTTVDKVTPMAALAPANAGVLFIAAGYSHSVAVK